jgi:hypothetical protein
MLSGSLRTRSALHFRERGKCMISLSTSLAMKATTRPGGKLPRSRKLKPLLPRPSLSAGRLSAGWRVTKALDPGGGFRLLSGSNLSERRNAIPSHS